MWLRFAMTIVAALLTLPALAEEKPAADVSLQEIEADIRYLSDDALGGRGLGSKGLELAADWHEKIFRELGLEPFFGKSFRQRFKLVGATPDPDAKLTFSVPGKEPLSPERLEQFVAVTWDPAHTVVEAPVVYAGHLIVAPGRQWDDVKDAGLKGKLVLVEVNEPGNYEGGIFDGPQMTWYGRWVYKFEEAARQGAAGILLLHTDKGAGYGWSVVRTGWSTEDFFRKGQPETGLGCMGWLNAETAQAVVRLAGKDLAALRKRAESPEFSPIPLGVSARLTQKPTFRVLPVENVAGILPSKAPEAKDRYVVVSAHFDHVGSDPKLEGDQIYNGAVDNCSATAAMMGVARHYSRHPENLPFNLIFVGLTAEEIGLVGSTYFARHLPFPTTLVWANINYEMTNVWGRTKDVHTWGGQWSELGKTAGLAAENLGWEYLSSLPDMTGMSFRSDQLSFARVGIPAVWLHEGHTGADNKRDARARRVWYYKNRNHKVSDEMEPDWDLDGTLQMIEWGLEIIRQLSTAPNRPKIYPGSGMGTSG